MAAKKSPGAATGAAKVFKAIRDHNVQVIDLRFCDMLGQWQHFSITKNEFDADAFVNGVGFDGSSIRGFQKIHESDMLLLPDPSTWFIEPFTNIQTLALICDIEDPLTRKP
jgi:glutamine synthetase